MWGWHRTGLVWSVLCHWKINLEFPAWLWMMFCVMKCDWCANDMFYCNSVSLFWGVLCWNGYIFNAESAPNRTFEILVQIDFVTEAAQSISVCSHLVQRLISANSTVSGISINSELLAELALWPLNPNVVKACHRPSQHFVHFRLSVQCDWTPLPSSSLPELYYSFYGLLSEWATKPTQA